MNWRKWRMSKISFTEDGIGKPEPLRGNLNGFWSRRIDGQTGWFTVFPRKILKLFPAGIIMMINNCRCPVGNYGSMSRIVNEGQEITLSERLSIKQSHYHVRRNYEKKSLKKTTHTVCAYLYDFQSLLQKHYLQHRVCILPRMPVGKFL